MSDQLHRLLDDGTGRVHPPLTGLLEALLAMPNPLNGWFWLRSPQVQTLLGDLATERLALTHDALHELPNWRTVAHLRDLLMHCGALPVVDKQLLHFQTWLHQRLAHLAGSPHHQLLRQFGLWHQRPRLAARAAVRPLTPAGAKAVREQFTHAQRFLIWLNQHDRAPGQLGQADIDTWHADARDHEKRALRGFLTWAIAARHVPRVVLPALTYTAAAPITQARRISLLRRVLNGHDAPLRSRVAACLLLLYAQPASRIVCLTVDDVIRDNTGQVFIRLGNPPVPVPSPIAELLLELADNRSNMNSATNPDSRWLFPGRRAGQPLHPSPCSRSSESSASPSTPPAPPRSASSSYKRQHRWSRTHWASTTSQPTATTSTPAASGRPTPRATTHGDPLQIDTKNIDYSINGHYQAHGPVPGQNNDAWFAGFTPSLSTAVWVGTDHNDPIRTADGTPISGDTLPGRIWHDVMTAFVASTPAQQFPPLDLIGQPVVDGSTATATTASATPAPTPTTDPAEPPTAPPVANPAPTPAVLYDGAGPATGSARRGPRDRWSLGDGHPRPPVGERICCSHSAAILR